LRIECVEFDELKLILGAAFGRFKCVSELADDEIEHDRPVLRDYQYNRGVAEIFERGQEK